MRVLITLAPAGVDTDWRVSRLALLPLFAGAVAENVNIDIREGVPVRELTSVLAAFFRLGRAPPTEPDTSMRRPTSAPHWLGMTGLVREFCHTPPDAWLLSLPVPTMKFGLRRVRRSPARSCDPGAEAVGGRDQGISGFSGAERRVGEPAAGRRLLDHPEAPVLGSRRRVMRVRHDEGAVAGRVGGAGGPRCRRPASSARRCRRRRAAAPRRPGRSRRWCRCGPRRPSR